MDARSAEEYAGIFTGYDTIPLAGRIPTAESVINGDYQADSGLWQGTPGDGSTSTCKYFISGMGMISEPVIPKISSGFSRRWRRSWLVRP